MPGYVRISSLWTGSFVKCVPVNRNNAGSISARCKISLYLLLFHLSFIN